VIGDFPLPYHQSGCTRFRLLELWFRYYSWPMIGNHTSEMLLQHCR
jgi:hypothetical protein